jgi:hypothetical protein
MMLMSYNIRDNHNAVVSMSPPLKKDHIFSRNILLLGLVESGSSFFTPLVTPVSIGRGDTGLGLTLLKLAAASSPKGFLAGLALLPLSAVAGARPGAGVKPALGAA